METICCSKDLIANIVKLKEEDNDGKMQNVRNIISFEGDISQEDLAKASMQRINIITFDEVVQAGVEN